MTRVPSEMVESELEDGERVVWVGQPLPVWFANGGAAELIFGVMWNGAILLGMRQHMRTGALGYAVLAYVVPLLIGLLLMSAPVWARRQLLRTAYVITNRRALVVRAGFRGSRTVQVFAPDRLVQMERIERRDGSGDLVFDVVNTGKGTGGRTERRGFLCVPDVSEVERLLRRTLLDGRIRTLDP